MPGTTPLEAVDNVLNDKDVAFWRLVCMDRNSVRLGVMGAMPVSD